jgi:virginiamycin B lyase
MRIANGRLLLAVMAAAVGIAVPAAAQTFSEYPIPSHPGGTPAGITTGPDGAVWFTEYTGNRIGRITTGGSITEFPTTTLDSNCRSIITGPDGALWFTEEGGSKIGRLLPTATPGTHPTEFPVPGRPSHITTGPDGALWFTTDDSGKGKVGRLTTAGELTNEFPLPGPSNGITTGPDRALWIANDSHIFKMTAEGVAGLITRFQPPTRANGAWQITTGPDNALWFTEASAGKIGRITTDGKIREFPVSKNANPSGIATGPDGALWFTEYCLPRGTTCDGYNKIGRITTNGTITEFTIPTAAVAPRAITTGADRALWFTEGGRIGRFAPH